MFGRDTRKPLENQYQFPRFFWLSPANEILFAIPFKRIVSVLFRRTRNRSPFSWKCKAQGAISVGRFTVSFRTGAIPLMDPRQMKHRLPHSFFASLRTRRPLNATVLWHLVGCYGLSVSRIAVGWFLYFQEIGQ